MTEDIYLDSFYLSSLYKPSKEDLQYLKNVNHNADLMQYIQDLSFYIGCKTAYLIQYNGEYIGFLDIANEGYKKLAGNNKELYIILDEEHQHNGFCHQLIAEVTDYLFQNEVDHVILSPFNAKIINIAKDLGFISLDGFKFLKENYQRKL